MHHKYIFTIPPPELHTVVMDVIVVAGEAQLLPPPAPHRHDANVLVRGVPARMRQHPKAQLQGMRALRRHHLVALDLV